ncbi:hypothetical protein NDN08_005874 [Rhodosorus marinus]|uniref:Glutathione transferase n=1 Tax=Rhodosorus marinus TaxID=101924 RepID=A0AAV8V4G4_9RHOD|nr:hypothetical protein NDN08_005874 [Rhodosorus marinus]
MSATKVNLQYLNLGPVGGRGGVVRFFMLANGIQYEEQLFALSNGEWERKKKVLIESGDNPAGTVPIVDIDGVTLTQHVAIMRYIANNRNLSSDEYLHNYVQDAVADQYQHLRDDWASNAFGSADQKQKLTTELAPPQLHVLDRLYAKLKLEDVLLSHGNKASYLWGDVAIFGILHDLVRTGNLTEEDMRSNYPNLHAVYKTFSENEAISKWIADKSQ